MPEYGSRSGHVPTPAKERFELIIPRALVMGGPEKLCFSCEHLTTNW